MESVCCTERDSRLCTILGVLAKVSTEKRVTSNASELGKGHELAPMVIVTESIVVVRPK